MRMFDSRLLGVRMETRSLSDLVAESQRAVIERRKPFVFTCANPHSLVVARGDPQFRQALDQASTVVADGVGCKWAAALAGIEVGPRITGSDFFAAVMSALDQKCGRVFFFGSCNEVLAKLVERVKRDFPHITVATLSPPFRVWSETENAAMIEAIREFSPDVLWVGMTAPKQEKWVARNVGELDVPVIGSIGAVFDYYAGVTQRAPGWVRRLGFEWLYRLPREPRRLWRRTLVSAPQFLWFVMRDRMVR